MAGSTGGRWCGGGRIDFASAQAFQEELDAFISKGALRLSGDALPEPLVPFDFQLVPPGGAPVPLRGMIVSNAGGVALVQILEFSQALTGRLRGATIPPAPGPPPGPPPGVPSPGAIPALFVPASAMVPPRAAPATAENRPATATATAATQRPIPSTTTPPGTGEGFDEAPAWATPRPATGVFPVAAAPASGPLEGSLDNPQGLTGVLALPLGPVAAVRDVAKVSTVGLLRYLGARRATGTLTLRGGPSGQRVLPIDRGSVLLSPQEREGLRPIFQWPTGSFEFVPGTPVRAAHRAPVSPWRLVLDAVKLLIRDVPPAELAAHLDASRAVRLTAAYSERSRSLELNPGEERLVQRDFDGRLSLREIYKLGAISEVSVQRLTFLLLALGLAELTTAEGTRAADDEVRAHYERIVAADLFGALGLHWSDPPDRLPAALDAVRARYGPGSPAAESSPEWAAKLIELAERAHRRLKDRAGRRAYRSELGVDVRHAAELLVQQVPLAKTRGELARALALMNAACDMHDRPEWEKLRAEVAALAPVPRPSGGTRPPPVR